MRVGLDFLYPIYVLMLYHTYFRSPVMRFMVWHKHPEAGFDNEYRTLSPLQYHVLCAPFREQGLSKERFLYRDALDVKDRVRHRAYSRRTRVSFQYQYRTSPSPSRYHPSSSNPVPYPLFYPDFQFHYRNQVGWSIHQLAPCSRDYNVHQNVVAGS